MIDISDIHRLQGVMPRKKKPRKTLRQQMQAAYYQRNKEHAKAYALARYHRMKAQ